MLLRMSPSTVALLCIVLLQHMHPMLLVKSLLLLLFLLVFQAPRSKNLNYWERRQGRYHPEGCQGSLPEREEDLLRLPHGVPGGGGILRAEASFCRTLSLRLSGKAVLQL